ncbi:MAG: hypothetical protein ABFD08_06615 [Syntrophomonas sp.]
MEKKTKLGMGLDLLLTANDARNDIRRDERNITQAQSLFEKAVAEDENGRVFEAYYLYRCVMEVLESQPVVKNYAWASLMSQTCNNIAVILYENNEIQGAYNFLLKAVNISPDNKTARGNLEQVGCDLP